MELIFPIIHFLIDIKIQSFIYLINPFIMYKYLLIVLVQFLLKRLFKYFIVYFRLTLNLIINLILNHLLTYLRYPLLFI